MSDMTVPILECFLTDPARHIHHGPREVGLPHMNNSRNGTRERVIISMARRTYHGTSI